MQWIVLLYNIRLTLFCRALKKKARSKTAFSPLELKLFEIICQIKKNPLSLHRFRSKAKSEWGLSYGVMVAQQVLVLFVLVRIQVGQL